MKCELILRLGNYASRTLLSWLGVLSGPIPLLSMLQLSQDLHWLLLLLYLKIGTQ
jgi:1,4-dihydroxy-2-naphthoate octaprenyltransferase